jgi:hypothetical protein
MVSNRITSQEPELQYIPYGKPGHGTAMVVGAGDFTLVDYAAIEARILAHYAEAGEDPRLVAYDLGLSDMPPPSYWPALPPKEKPKVDPRPAGVLNRKQRRALAAQARKR